MKALCFKNHGENLHYSLSTPLCAVVRLCKKALTVLATISIVKSLLIYSHSKM